MPDRVMLEVCVASLEDAQVAEAGGADRLELNVALSLGGLTPPAGLTRAVVRAVRIPVVAMLRPREGGFCYSAAEFATMQADLQALLDAGVRGVAFGILTPDRQLDSDRMGLLRQMLGSREAVCHRAFDLARDPGAALDWLISQEFTRLLTSGQRVTAAEGAAEIRRWSERAAGRIEILPGSGIRPENVRSLLAQTGVTQVHASLKTPRSDPTQTAGDVIQFGPDPGGEYAATDLAKVRQMRRMLDLTTEVAEADEV